MRYYEPEKKTKKDTLTIVYLARLFYRKGPDLLIELIPKILKKYPHVKFLIGGDGPKCSTIRAMIEELKMEDKVTLDSKLHVNKIREFLGRGDIFLNSSLTEAFCICLIEAASSGCYCVSTNIGGVPEVLPKRMRTLCDPSVESLFKGLCEAIENYNNVAEETHTYHAELKKIYNWDDVSYKTVLL